MSGNFPFEIFCRSTNREGFFDHTFWKNHSKSQLRRHAKMPANDGLKYFALAALRYRKAHVTPNLT